MSRCFPYPPPGFVKNSGEGAVLKVWEESHKDNKERKERKKDRKHKEKSYGDNGMVKEKKHREHKRNKHERSKEKHVGGDCAKRREEENEQMDMSSLTEELGQPVGAQNFSDSFDSAHCRGKRPNDQLNSPCEPSHKKQRTTCDASGTHGKGLWIRLSVLKNSEQQQASKQAFLTEPAVLPQARETTSILLNDGVGHGKAEAHFEDRTDDVCFPLPRMCFEPTEPENLDWLFGKEHRARDTESLKANKEAVKGVSQVWERACYLPSAGIYALPFVVPY